MQPQHKNAKIIMTMRGVTATRQKNCLTKEWYCLLVRLYVTVVFKLKPPSTSRLKNSFPTHDGMEQMGTNGETPLCRCLFITHFDVFFHFPHYQRRWGYYSEIATLKSSAAKRTKTLLCSRTMRIRCGTFYCTGENNCIDVTSSRNPLKETPSFRYIIYG